MAKVFFYDHSDTLTMDASMIDSALGKSYKNFYGNSEYLRIELNDEARVYFDMWRNQWLDETKYNSNISSSMQHPLYSKILSLGDIIVPFLIMDLRENKTHWFYALTALTGENPILKEHSGQVDNMIADWVKWAEVNSII